MNVKILLIIIIYNTIFVHLNFKLILKDFSNFIVAVIARDAN